MMTHRSILPLAASSGCASAVLSRLAQGVGERTPTATRFAPWLRSVAGIILATCCAIPLPAWGQVLFDNTKSESVANANWIIDTHQPIPSPSITGITSATLESYWTGALSSWGVALAKLRNSGQISLPGNGLETLPPEIRRAQV